MHGLNGLRGKREKEIRETEKGDFSLWEKRGAEGAEGEKLLASRPLYIWGGRVAMYSPQRGQTAWCRYGYVRCVVW